MRPSAATVRRIILVFACRFGAALLLTFGVLVPAQAQSAYSLQLEIGWQGRSFKVAPTVVGVVDRVELIVEPIGSLRAYGRAVALPGVDGQVMLDLQVYQLRKGSLLQLTSFTMPSFLGTTNSSETVTVDGPLLVRAYVDVAAAGAGAVPGSPAPPPPAPAPRATQMPLTLDAPVKPRPLAIPPPPPPPAE